MSGGGRVLSGWAAARLQAGWSARRFLRGRSLWVAAFFALGPIGFAAVAARTGHAVRWVEFVAPLVLLSAIVATLFTASAVADEIEDKTFIYLWSRPLPRWSMLIGKLMATAPLTIAVLAAAAAIAYQLGAAAADPARPWPAMALLRLLGAMAAAAVALSMVSGGIAALVPRHGLGVTYGYLLLLDFPVGAMPFSLANLSLLRHITIAAGAEATGTGPGSPAGSAAWLFGIGAFWLGLGLWRISRSEFGSGER